MISNSDYFVSNFHEHFDEPPIQIPRRGMSYMSLSKLLEYDVSDVDKSSLTKHKKKLYQLAIFADVSRVQIHFHGLEDLKKRYEMLFCNTWNSEKDYPVERELFDLLSNIQMQSNVSHRKYDIKLVG